MAVRSDEARLPDFSALGAPRASTRFFPSSTVLFESSHVNSAGPGGLVVTREAVVLGASPDTVHVTSADLLGWMMESGGGSTSLVVWSHRTAAPHRTVILRQFTSAARSAMAEAFGFEGDPLPEAG
ncbi:hypothetical protein KXS11_11725 [Plantibacter flavus]|uniref:hypothetical protein n=1 Tax=Plantibacter flavus TaxID=150123 RepID=UPI003F15C7FB